MPVYPVEQFKKERIMERLQHAMIEALFTQGLLTEAQRQALCLVMKCENAAFPERSDTIEKTGFGGKRGEKEA